MQNIRWLNRGSGKEQAYCWLKGIWMGAETICVNTILMEKDMEALQYCLLEIYQSMERLEVNLTRLESFWEGVARETYFQAVWEQWGQLLSKKQVVEEGIGQLERIRELYMSCERQVMEAIWMTGGY